MQGLTRNLGIATAVGLMGAGGMIAASRDHPDAALHDTAFTAASGGAAGSIAVGGTTLLLHDTGRVRTPALALAAIPLLAGVGVAAGAMAATGLNGHLDPTNDFSGRSLSKPGASTRLHVGRPYRVGYTDALQTYRSLAEMQRVYGEQDAVSTHPYPGTESNVLIEDRDRQWHAYALTGDSRTVQDNAPVDIGARYVIVTRDGQFEPSADGTRMELTRPRRDFITEAARQDRVDTWHRIDNPVAPEFPW